MSSEWEHIHTSNERISSFHADIKGLASLNPELGEVGLQVREST